MVSLVEFPGHLLRQELLAEFLRIYEGGAAEAHVQQAGKRPRAARDQAAEDFAAIVRERQHEAANIPRRHPGGIGRTEQRADRAAGDDGRLSAQLVEGFEDGDMRDPARAASAQGKREAPAHPAPAWRANSHALHASGRTSGAMASAFSLVAVPSRTRPTIPCRIAARRKKL